MAYIVSFINMKGGVAKTTLAVNVADFLATQDSLKVLVVDIDPQFNATQYLMSAAQYEQHMQNKLPTIYEVFDDVEKLSGGVVESIQREDSYEFEDIVPVKIKPNLYLLPGSIELFRLDNKNDPGLIFNLKRYLEYWIDKESFEYIIIDTPPTPSNWMASGLVASHFYLIPVKPDPLSFIGTDLLESTIALYRKRLGLDIKCVGLVLTICDRRTNVYTKIRDTVKESAKWSKYLYASDLPKKTKIAEMTEQQQLILDLNISDLSADLASITREMRRRIEDDV